MFLGGIIIGLILLEGFLMLNPKFGYNYSSFKFKREKPRYLNLNANNVYLRPSELLGYEIVPNCKEDMPTPANSYGLIGKEYKLDKDADTFRILLLGDSIAWQDGTRKSLEEMLIKNPPAISKHKFEIWNAGVPSYDVRRYYLFLKYKGLNYKPDMVLIFLFMNDFDPNLCIYYKNKNGLSEYYFPIKGLSKFYKVSPFFMKHSYLYRFIILNMSSYLLNKRKADNVNNSEKDTGRYYLTMIKELCDKYKMRLVIVIFPYLKPMEQYATRQIYEYKTICSVVENLGSSFINLYKELSGLDLVSLRQRKEDEIHPSLDGQRVIAKIIYNSLLPNF